MASSDLAQALSPDTALDLDCTRPLDAGLVADVNALCERLEDSTVRPVGVIRLHGAHAARDWPGRVGIDLVSRWEKALRRLEQTRAPRIVTAEGVCGGLGLEVLLTGDHRIGTPDLRIDVPVNDGGVWAGMAVHRLTNQLGGVHTRRLVLFGAEVTARRALVIGLIDQVAADPGAAAAKLAERLDGLEPAELAIRRQLVHDAGVTAFEDALGRHLAACERSLRRTRGEFADAV
ncbi:enoyl-CoA-hydratase DpgB [Streptomyces sp. NPDC052301]|uniref:enoyl-CoA-hydratase DpgB n=1 Tax=Streptomyces sp. NPDC052301 TaxID=3365687 RepID=UPI0037D7EBCE